MENVSIQVQKEHYDFNKYVSGERWASYYEQIINILSALKKQPIKVF